MNFYEVEKIYESDGSRTRPIMASAKVATCGKPLTPYKAPAVPVTSGFLFVSPIVAMDGDVVRGGMLIKQTPNRNTSRA